MEYSQISVDIKTLQTQHAQLDNAIREEENHIWKDMIKIEQLKKAKLKKKDELLKRTRKFS